MIDPPRVSIVTAFLNGGHYLPEAVASVLSQSFESWELLLVDDGSTDGSTEYARALAADHPGRVRYLEHSGHRNRGATVSRNLGLAHARGEFVAILDADDVWLPRKLGSQVAILDDHPEVAMTFGEPLYWRSWRDGDPAGDEVRRIWTAPDAVVNPPEMMKLSYPLGPGGSPCPSDLLVRRALVERIGGFEEEFVGKFQLFEDIAFLAKVYLNGAVFVSGERWLKYRVHDASCVSRVRHGDDYLRVRHFYLRWLVRYLREQGVGDPEIDEAVARLLRKHDPILIRWARKQLRRAAHLMTNGSSR